MNRNLLVKKYNIPGPRYTSYPTVPFWDQNTFSDEKWIDSIQNIDSEGISLYVHLPYCESLCTFCACHKRITKNHDVEKPYIDALIKEWEIYLQSFPSKPVINEIHLGGGTPSFFSPENLKRLLENILKNAEVSPNHTFSFEGHPNNTSYSHLLTLFNLGFKRVSFGVQDFDLTVQKAINRLQPFENVESVVNLARQIGYESISLDLVYGLPFQTPDSILNTARKSISLVPDRISFYSYAHVPWIKGTGQRGYKESDLPKDEEKRNLYESCLEVFEENHYYEVGMDHFALEHDELFEAQKNKTLNRNFMGYTCTQSKTIIGLGASAISDNWDMFVQNEKSIEKYIDNINSNNLALIKGHKLSNEDMQIRTHIRNLMCDFETDLDDLDIPFIKKEIILARLQDYENDGLLNWSNNKILVTETGKAFVRNICMEIDQYFKKNTENLFSRTI
jgi:oxygen-independent coproporphyrinogen III oxidase